jgi:hypothetical protein
VIFAVRRFGIVPHVSKYLSGKSNMDMSEIILTLYAIMSVKFDLVQVVVSLNTGFTTVVVKMKSVPIAIRNFSNVPIGR